MPKVYNKHHKNAPPDAVYVGRPSKFGNPFVMGKHGDREQVVKLFRMVAEYVMTPIDKLDRTLSIDFGDDNLNNWSINFTAEDIKSLRGKDLVCWCAPKPCHADVLLELANKLEDQL